jgi:hypothetical protein
VWAPHWHLTLLLLLLLLPLLLVVLVLLTIEPTSMGHCIHKPASPSSVMWFPVCLAGL